MLKDLLKTLGVNMDVYDNQDPAEQSKVLILVIGLILSPFISGIVLGAFVALMFQSRLVGWVVGGCFGLLLFFLDRSFLKPVPDRTLYIRFAVSLVLGLVFSLGVKFWIFEDNLRADYVQEIETYNANIYRSEVLDFEEELFRQEQELQAELSKLGKLQVNTRRVDEYQQRIDKQRQLDTLRARRPVLVAQKIEGAELQYKEANPTQMNLFLHLIETLFGKKGDGFEWFINGMIFLLAFFLESWAFIGAIVLRDGEYMREVEAINEYREEERNRRIVLNRELQSKERQMDQMVMGDDTSIPELRKHIVLNALKKEYSELARKERPTKEDRQRFQEVIDELEEVTGGASTPYAYQSTEDALQATMQEFDTAREEDDVPPEFTYES